MLTEQLPPASMHVPPGVNVTIPVGVVGDALVSVTVAVHDVAWLTTTVEGEQEMVVVVGLRAAGIMARLKVLLLPEWAPSPEYEPVMISVLLVAVPVGKYVTWQLAFPTVPLSARTHGDVVTVPVPLLLIETAPVGVKAFGTSVSVTVTVHVVLEPICTGAGEQTTLVAVDRGFMVRRSVKLAAPL
jgi:hypothetical protein